MPPRTPLTIAIVGRKFGLRLPSPKKPYDKGFCPLRKHKRTDLTFRVYCSKGSSDELWKCWSCDEPNAGDAVELYARLAGMDRKAAYKQLAEEGYLVPGIEEYDRAQEERERSRSQGATSGRVERGHDRRGAQRASDVATRADPPIPIRGSRPAEILTLPEERWRGWLQNDTGTLRRFAERRRIPEAFLKAWGVVEIDSGHVGFLYVDPMTNRPCRAKIKVLDPAPNRPPYWIEPRLPRGTEGGGRALDALYLAHRLKPRDLGHVEPVIITEGEVDALSLASVGICNVVSLPDGNASAASADLTPLFGRFTVWMVATDADAPGEKSYRILRDRGLAYGVEVVRVYWDEAAPMVQVPPPEPGPEHTERRAQERSEGALGGEQSERPTPRRYKDSNEALQAGWGYPAFAQCLDVALEARFGFTVIWCEETQEAAC